MRPLALSIGVCILVLGVAWAQSPGGIGGAQLPVGQSFRNFQFPIYQDSVLKATLSAVQATGITLNRADTTNLEIDLYDDGNITTRITSPRADLYVADRKMRTKSTVRVSRSDMDITSQICDFDLNSKKYLFRTNVKTVLKNFDVGSGLSDTSSKTSATQPATSSSAQHPQVDGGLLLDSPGGYASTNSAPLPPNSPETK